MLDTIAAMTAEEISDFAGLPAAPTFDDLVEAADDIAETARAHGITFRGGAVVVLAILIDLHPDVVAKAR